MKELNNHYSPFIKVLIIPYLIIMFILVYPIDFSVTSPGGLAEVEALIEIDYNQDKVVEGTISTTYVMSVKRPSAFVLIVGSFSPYSNITILSGTSLTYTNSEIAEISYLDKATSVDAAIIVAYEKAALENPEIIINYDVKVLVYGKAEYLDHYDEISFGDEFVKVVGDNGLDVTDISEIATYTVDNDAYVWYFLNEDGEEYHLTLSKDEETGKFGVTLKTYYIVNQETTYPTYREGNSNIGGPSGGLLSTLSIYNMLVDEDLTHGLKIAGTGTIGYDGSVGYIGGVSQKIVTAYYNKVDVFFIPALDENYIYDNYQEALRACEAYGLDPTGWLVPVKTFQDVLDYLGGLDNE